jgi:RNA polymerase sigma factor (sigma-70 family)
MSDAVTITTRAPIRTFRSKRLLALAGDDRLVEQIRRGNELAFEVAFERHGAGILGFCRHMVGSREEAEDVVQHTFAAAFRDLQRDGERRIALKAWLYTIARNRCVSVLRARREQAAELQELPTEGLSAQVERRAELRELLSDVRELPEDQRAALLLAEAAGLSHAEVAQVLGCEVGGVKGLVFRARSSLIERRVARETPCGEIREQLATLRGGALRRNELRHHLRSCPGCSAYREELRHQRKLLALALPVTPTLGLKATVLGAAGLTGGAVGGTSAGALALGSAAMAKVVIVGVIAGGSIVAGEVVIDRVAQEPAQVAPAPGATHEAGRQGGPGNSAAVETRGAHGERISTERSHGLRGAERRAARSRGKANGRSKNGQTGDRSPAGGRKLGQEKRAGNGSGAPRVRSIGKDPAAKAKPERIDRGQSAPAKPAPQARTVPKPKVQAAPDPVAPVVVPEASPAPPPNASAPGQLKQSK